MAELRRGRYELPVGEEIGPELLWLPRGGLEASDVVGLLK
jgi:hypothetical protein